MTRTAIADKNRIPAGVGLIVFFAIDIPFLIEVPLSYTIFFKKKSIKSTFFAKYLRIFREETRFMQKYKKVVAKRYGN
jgi:hypothetical protein